MNFLNSVVFAGLFQAEVGGHKAFFSHFSLQATESSASMP